MTEQNSRKGTLGMLLKTTRGWQIQMAKPSLAPHFGQQSWEKGVPAGEEKKKDPFGKNTDNFCKAVRTPTGKACEEVDSRNYRKISLDRWIFLYRSNFCFLPACFLTPRMTPAAPCCTAGSSFLKEILSRCQIQSEQCR